MIKQRGSAFLHFLDRYAGIPVIAALGSMKAKRRLPSRIQRIGLLRTVAIGDTVLLSAVAADLRCAFPEASLIFFAGPSNFEMASMLDEIDKVVPVPTGNPAAGIRAVRSVPVDVMLDFGPWPRLDALLVLFSTASFTAGFATSGQHRHYGYDLTVEHSSERHELENYRSLLRALGIEAKSSPCLRFPQAGAPFAQNQVVLHLWPGGRLSQLKQWPLEKWLRLIDDFDCWGMNVVLTGAPADRAANDALIARVEPSLRGRVTNAAGISLEKTAAMCR
jgi:ADP-heptose:LPS heptosyltransferase